MSDGTGGGHAAAGGAAHARSRFPLAKLALALLVLAALLGFGRLAGGYVDDFRTWVDGLGFWGPLAFIAGYAIAVVAFLPGSALTLAGGAVFGLGEGVLYVFVAALLGSTAAFLVARYLARSAVERRIQGDARFAAIDRAVGEQGRRIVFLLRLSPIFPFNLLNYALGLTRVGLLDYLVASLGMLPGTLLYVYAGSVGGELAEAAGGARTRGTAEYALLILGLLATVVVTTLVTRIARDALREQTGAGAGKGTDAAADQQTDAAAGKATDAAARPADRGARA